MQSLLHAAALAAAALLALTPPACGQDTLISAAEARADLERLYEGLQSAEAGLYAETPRAVFDARYRELQARLVHPVTASELHAELQRFTALARHGHTRIEGLNPGWSEHLSQGGLLFPLSLRVEHGEVIVSEAPADSPVQPGDRITGLEGDPNPIWLARLTRNISAETPELAYAILASGDPYYVWLEYGPRDRFNLQVDRDGTIEAVSVPAISLDAYRALNGPDAGVSLDGRDARLLTADIAYLRPGAFYNLDATRPEEAFLPDALDAYTAWLDAAFEDFIAAGAEHLILDLRDNPGGDNSYSDPVVAWFADEAFRFASDFRILVSPETIASNQARLDAQGESAEADSVSARFAALYAEAGPGERISFDIPWNQPREEARFDGEVHVLINRYSYSNAVTTAAMIQDYGFGTLYGEPTRDMATTYGALEHFTLPHSGFSVGFPKAHIIRPNGEERSHPVTPDVIIPAPSIRTQDDVVLNALVARLTAE